MAIAVKAKYTSAQNKQKREHKPKTESNPDNNVVTVELVVHIIHLLTESIALVVLYQGIIFVVWSSF